MRLFAANLVSGSKTVIGGEIESKQLKGELGLDHYEGRSWLGWHHHTALVSAAHGFLTLERLCPQARRPA